MALTHAIGRWSSDELRELVRGGSDYGFGLSAEGAEVKATEHDGNDDDSRCDGGGGDGAPTAVEIAHYGSSGV